MNQEQSNSVILKAIENTKVYLTEADLPLIKKVEDYVKEGDYLTAFHVLEDYAEKESKSLANLNCLAGVIGYKIIEEEEK